MFMPGVCPRSQKPRISPPERAPHLDSFWLATHQMGVGRRADQLISWEKDAPAGGRHHPLFTSACPCLHVYVSVGVYACMYACTCACQCVDVYYVCIYMACVCSCICDSVGVHMRCRRMWHTRGYLPNGPGLDGYRFSPTSFRLRY